MKDITQQFVIDDPFSTSIRQYIPWDDYLKLHEQQRQLSLCNCSLQNIAQDTILNRIRELEALESIGFVYVAEKKWLLSYVHNLHQLAHAHYADWLFCIFQTVIVDKPLKWGVYEDEQGHTSEQYQNIWCATAGNTKLLPWFSELKSAEVMESLLLEGELAIEIYGPADKPHPVALTRTFEFLHDLPYYLELAKTTLCTQDYNADIEGVSVIEAGSDFNCSLIYGTDYESGLSIEFKNRKRQNYTDDLFEQLPYLKLLIERNLAPQKIPELADLLAADIIEEIFTSNFRKTLFGYLDLFDNSSDNSDYQQLVRAIWQADYRLSKDDIPDAEQLKVISFSSLLDCSIDCQKCGETFDSDLSFRWGSEINYPTYQVGDFIHWQSSNTGADYYDELFIAATALSQCPHCAHTINHTLIQMSNNKIIGCSEVQMSALKYGLSGAPFISQQLIPIKTFEREYFVSKVTEAIAIYDNDMLKALKAQLENDKPLVGSSKWQIKIKKVFYQLRHYFDEAKYKRISRSLDLQFFSLNAGEPIGHNSHVKSCCILKDVKLDGITGDYVFYWGSLLDFPEYYLDDQIQWSEYSVGDESLRDMYLIAHALDANQVAHRTIKVCLKDGIIADVLPYDSCATGVIGDDFRIAYYLDNQPYLTWKDRYIMRF